MKGPDGFVQAYNAQAAVEPALQLIVGQALTQQANDKQQLLPIAYGLLPPAIIGIGRRPQRGRDEFNDIGYGSIEGCAPNHLHIHKVEVHRVSISGGVVDIPDDDHLTVVEDLGRVVHVATPVAVCV